MLKHRQSHSDRPPESSPPQDDSSKQMPSGVTPNSATTTATATTTTKTRARTLAATQTRILQLSLLVRTLSLVFLIVTSQLQQAFDTSHELLSYSLDPALDHGLSAGTFSAILAFVRWDTIHFLSSATPSPSSSSHYAMETVLHKGGYRWEQTLAFQPGIVALLRAAGYVTPSMDGHWSPTSAILLTTLLANILTTLGPVLLYRLTWKVAKNAKLAQAAAVLSIFAPSAGTTLSSPTPESFYSFASLVGLLSLESDRWFQAAVWFGVATCFRQNGVLLVGYPAYKFVICDRVRLSSVLKLVLSTAVCISSSVLFQLWAYSRFCTRAVEEKMVEDGGRPWCGGKLPSAYGFVQSHYWNVGFLRYWQVQQLPNFVLAAPVLAMIAYTTCAFYRHASWSHILSSVLRPPFTPPTSATEKEQDLTRQRQAQQQGLALDTTPRATPYMLHGLAIGTLLLVASHIQIALRFATPGGIPTVWWGAAHLILDSTDRDDGSSSGGEGATSTITTTTRKGEGPAARRRTMVVTYLALQYTIGMVLYAGFYPPA